MEWQRLDNATGLAALRGRLTLEWGVGPSLMIWGPDPAEYPCLVAYMRTASNRAVPVVVYRVDAANLLQVGLPAAQPAPEAPPGPTPADNYRSVAAHLMTMAHWMHDVGCYKTYERDYIRNLAAIDQYTAEAHAKIIAGKILELRVAG